MNNKNTFNHHYYNTYYYANIIERILRGDQVELLGFINNFFEISAYSFLQPFQKKTAMHSFISITIMDFFLEDMYDYDEHVFKSYRSKLHHVPLLYAEKVMREYDLHDYVGEPLLAEENLSYEEIEAYHEDILLAGYIEECVDRITEEVFYILFNNRNLLANFNLWVSYRILESPPEQRGDEELPYFTAKGLVKRVSIPTWAKKAVYFRDRGRCCNCNKDLSNTLSIQNKQHYDHIVPLKLGGINDVSNLQLLCDSCNQSKGGIEIYTSRIYEKWF